MIKFANIPRKRNKQSEKLRENRYFENQGRYKKIKLRLLNYIINIKRPKPGQVASYLYKKSIDN